MSWWLVYVLLLKASLTSFSGLGSLPMVRNDFVVERHVLSERELNTAVAAGRTGPGPFGLYLVCVGYVADGIPGALAAGAALVTPAFLALPAMLWIGKRADSPFIKRLIRSVVLSGAGLLLASNIPLARDAIQGPLTLSLLVASAAVLTFTKIETVWVILVGAIVGMAGHYLQIS